MLWIVEVGSGAGLALAASVTTDPRSVRVIGRENDSMLCVACRQLP